MYIYTQLLAGARRLLCAAHIVMCTHNPVSLCLPLWRLGEPEEESQGGQRRGGAPGMCVIMVILMVCIQPCMYVYIMVGSALQALVIFPTPSHAA